MAPNPVSIISQDPKVKKTIITKEFLENSLQKEANGDPIPKILSHTTTLGTKPGDNYMSIIYSVDVQLDNGTNRHLIVKCYPNHPGHQELANKRNVFFKECETYSIWVPELKRLQTEVLGLTSDQVIKLPYAHFVHGECIDFQSSEGAVRKSERIQSLDNFILMDDIRKTQDFRMANRLKPLDIHHMRLVIEALANLHSLSWAYRHHVEKNIIQKFTCLRTTFTKEYIAGVADFVNSNLSHAESIYDSRFGVGNKYSAAAQRFRTISLVVGKYYLEEGDPQNSDNFCSMLSGADLDKFGKDSDKPEPWRIISHGDCWIMNLLFRYDPESGMPCEVVLVDLQAQHESCVVNDLEHLIHACTDLDLRREHTDELLQLYHDTFNRVCDVTKTPTLPGFNMDSLRFRYHRGKLFGFYTAMTCLPIMLKEQSELIDFDDVESDKDFAEVFSEWVSNLGSNSILMERLIGLTQGMIEDGRL